MTDFITTDYSNNDSKDFALLPKNNYEMIIKSVQEKATKNGKESLQIDLQVRDDLDKALPETNGKYHKRIVFNPFWKRDINGQYQYDMTHFQYVLEAVGIPAGTKLASVEDFIKAIVNKPVLVYVDQQENEYNGETTTQNTVAPWGYKQTKFPTVANQADPFEGQKVDVDPADLPF